MFTKLDKLLQKCRRNNLEVFRVSGKEARENVREAKQAGLSEGPVMYKAGYYWWSCSPGCLPDSDPSGPYTSPTRAAEAALDVVE